MMHDALYAASVAAIRPDVNHARTPDSERRYVVTLPNGGVRYTDSPANVARWGGTVEDRGL